MMNAKENNRANRQTDPASRTVTQAAVVTALVSIIFLAMWSPTAADVAQGERNSTGIESRSASLAGSNEHDERVNKAGRLARDYSQWLLAAHDRAGVASQEQPLPPQF